jgi:hypothetical protein
VKIPREFCKVIRRLNPRRFLDPDYTAAIAADIYGGTVRTHPGIIKRLFGRHLMAGSQVGYLRQLLAGSDWTSIFALPLIRQDTLIVAGSAAATWS